MRLLRLILVVASFGFPALTYAQTPCPTNIDFSEGTFNKWVCSIGSVNKQGIVSVTAGPATPGRQTLVQNISTEKDFYGNFSIVAPNGSKNTLILGNGIGGAEAEQVSYTYSIPADKKDFIFTYYYAVVLQLTNHLDFERPRFSVKLTDITNPSKPEAIPCGTHDFVSGDGLGDFKKSTTATDVEYRDWSTVAVNLADRAGHTIRFDFTTNDCVYSAHFGYAYLSFSDPCDLSSQSITGNTFCTGSSALRLTAPPGFDTYTWRLAGQQEVLSYDRQYSPAIIPPDGTKYVVDAQSFTGLGSGCPASFATTVHVIDKSFVFKLQPSKTACASTGIDLTDPALKAGSSTDLTYKYFADANQNEVVRDPTSVTKGGRYYILGTNTYGCSDIRSIDLNLLLDPEVTIKQPKPVCKPATVDITDPAITGGVDPTLTYTYFTDGQLTRPLINPKTISENGVYYIKITNATGCFYRGSITVSILEKPVLVPKAVSGCAPFNIAAAEFDKGDINVSTYRYFKDAAGMIPLDNPDAITQGGVYYQLGYNAIGCPSVTTVPVSVTINPSAQLTVEKPAAVKYPATIDLSAAVMMLGGYSYSYFIDSLGTKPLKNYATINQTGKYFIKATNTYGCDITRSVLVTVNESDPVDIKVSNTFSPNGDGINDEFNPTLVGAANVNYLKIYSRNGSLVFETKDLAQHWKGAFNGAPVPPGTYYWVFSGYDNYRKITVAKSGYIMLVR